MNNNMIPFDEQKWKEGWKPVTRDGRGVEDFKSQYGWLLGKVNGKPRTWYTNGLYFVGRQSQLDLMLLPPDDEIVVEVTEHWEMSVRSLHCIFPKDLKAGKYRLTKIG